MNKIIIGRKEEQLQLKKALDSIKAEFIAVYGRRRVGKTYLVNQFFLKEKCLLFHTTGKYQGSMEEQLALFTKTIVKTFFEDIGVKVKPLTNWMDTFELLTNNIEKLTKKEKIVLFFDELPWLATKRAGFLEALDYYWNTIWSKNKKIILVVCGSAASWMIKNIVNNKGGLHNRITIEIPLYPFTLKEAQDFLEYLGFKLNCQQILELYMVFGGIPHYLEKIQKELSIVQNISKLCFSRGGSLQSEFENLFSSLFDNAPAYVELINVIGMKREGVLRSDLDKKAKLSESGGTLTERLEALERAGFIRSFIPIEHTDRGLYYKIIDEYCLFYLSWIRPVIKQLKDEVDLYYWQAKVNTSAWKSWSGYAFESICRKHISQIRRALYIPPDALGGSWKYVSKQQSKEKGTQIDLLFDRSDGAISICEIKYSEKPFLIDKNYAENLANKIDIYRKQTKTKKQIILSMITTNGIKKSVYSEKMVMGIVTLSDLFKQ
jgi:hypothetical protein